jgi:hypothetical protein
MATASSVLTIAAWAGATIKLLEKLNKTAIAVARIVLVILLLHHSCVWERPS